MKFIIALVLGVSAQNPLQKVLQLLGELQQKVLKEGEVEQKQYEKFAEWCKDGAVAKQYEIQAGKAKVEELSAVIEKEGSTITMMESKIEDAAKKVSVNEADLQSATEIRDKEAADFAAADTDLESTIDMLSRAVGIIEKNMRGSGFLQAGNKDVVNALNALVQASSISASDRSALTAMVQQAQGDGEDDDFLSKSAPDAKAYESHSGSILDTLEDMKEKAVEMRNNGQKEEMNAKHAFEMLAQSLKNSIAQDQKELGEAKASKAAAEEAKSMAEGDLAMTEKELASDEKSLGDMSTDCQSKAADWEVSTKSRAEELQALADAKKMIEEKTGGAGSRAYDFLQQESSTKSSAQVASDAGDHIVTMLQTLGKSSGDLALSQLALRVRAAVQMQSGADPFGKVKGMISEMIDKLVQNAAEEASHKAFCDKEMSESKEKIEDHTSTIDKFSTRKDKATAAIEKLKEETATLQSELATIAKAQADMDGMRVDEKAAFAEAKKDYEDGIEGLTRALQILRDYYAEKSESLLQQPDVGVHSKASGAATGIIGLLEVSQSDFTKLLADATVEEEAAEKEYEKISQENRVQTAMKDADVKYKTKEVASLEKSVSEFTSDIDSEQTELDAVLEYYEKLKPGCIAKPMTYAERKQRREAEIAGLKEALTILEGETPAAFLALRTRTVRRHA
jgi:hypothetical protein